MVDPLKVDYKIIKLPSQSPSANHWGVFFYPQYKIKVVTKGVYSYKILTYLKQFQAVTKSNQG